MYKEDQLHYHIIKGLVEACDSPLKFDNYNIVAKEQVEISRYILYINISNAFKVDYLECFTFPDLRSN